MNNFDLMRNAIEEAKATQRAADSQVQTFAKILAENGRLRSVNFGTLCSIKKQLANFNMTTGKWSI